MMRPMTLQSHRALLIPPSQKEIAVKIDLKEILGELGLPFGLVALFAAILGLFGTPLDLILKIVEGLTGTFALIALLINVGKYIGVVKNETAGKWSAAANLVVVLAVAVVFKLYPTFNFAGVDAQIMAFVKVAAVVFAYIIQLVGSKRVHMAMTYGLWIPAFSHTLPRTGITWSKYS